MSESQVWQVALTARERWVLTMLFLSPSIKLKTALDKGRHRRARDAFGVAHIVAVLRENKNSIRTAKADEDIPALHTLTAENVDYVFGLVDSIETAGEQAVVLDEMGERLKAAKDGASTPTGLAEYDAMLDAGWEPDPPAEDKPGALRCPSCGQTFDVAEVRPPNGAEAPA